MQREQKTGFIKGRDESPTLASLDNNSIFFGFNERTDGRWWIVNNAAPSHGAHSASAPRESVPQVAVAPRRARRDASRAQHLYRETQRAIGRLRAATAITVRMPVPGTTSRDDTLQNGESYARFNGLAAALMKRRDNRESLLCVLSATRLELRRLEAYPSKNARKKPT